MFLIILFVPFMVNGKELKLEWQKSWSGNKSNSFKHVINTKDNGYIVISSTASTDIKGIDNKKMVKLLY